MDEKKIIIAQIKQEQNYLNFCSFLLISKKFHFFCRHFCVLSVLTDEISKITKKENDYALVQKNKKSNNKFIYL